MNINIFVEEEKDAAFMSNLRIFIIKTMFPELPASQNKIQIYSTSITSILHFVSLGAKISEFLQSFITKIINWN